MLYIPKDKSRNEYIQYSTILSESKLLNYSHVVVVQKHKVTQGWLLTNDELQGSTSNSETRT